MEYPKSKYTKEDCESLWEAASKDEILFNAVSDNVHAALVEKHFPPLRFSGTISDNSFNPGSTMSTLEDLKVGDVLDCDDEEKRTVLAVVGKVICVSWENDTRGIDDWYTLDQIKRMGWTLHQEPEPKKIIISKEACDELIRFIQFRVAKCYLLEVEAKLKLMVE